MSVFSECVLSVNCLGPSNKTARPLHAYRTASQLITLNVREFEKEPEELMFNIGLTKQHRTHSG